MPEPLRNQPLLTEVELRARLGEFYASLEQFNEGWFFESHETLEDLWMVTPFPERDFFQGIIQMAAAFVHLVRGEYPGILKLLDAAADKLARSEPSCFGVDVTALVADVRRARDDIAALGPEEFLTWHEGDVPKVRFERDG